MAVKKDEKIERNPAGDELRRQAKNGSFVTRLTAFFTPSTKQMKDSVQLRKSEDKNAVNHFMALSKFRLTMLVTITSAAGFGLATSATHVFDPVAFVACTVGVCMTSAAANAINQYLEVPFDSQMNRTKNRVLVRGTLTPAHAIGFALVSAASGTILLYEMVNPLASVLSMSNLILYTSVYTPMKRISITNTWIGSVVGALPPVIGWVGATGGLDAGAAILGGILYTWQFPHFNSLSWNLRPDYSRAGYRMMAVTNPELCKRVALRHSIGCLLVCSIGAPLLDVTTPIFALLSFPLNSYLVMLAEKFKRRADSSSSRTLFRYTLVHLPILMTLMFVCRKKSDDNKASTYDKIRNALLYRRDFIDRLLY